MYDDGITTDVGMNDGTDGTLTIAVDGIETMTEVGTVSGTLVHSTITADGDEAIVITSVDGSLETNETGTTTGLDQVDGMVTVAGTKTNDDVGTVTTIELGTD